MPGNRCADCNKWVSLETDEPQEDSIDVSDDGVVSIDVTVSRNCADCGTEMKNYNFQTEDQIDESWVAEHAHDDAQDNGHGEWSVETSDLESTETGGGRYSKNMIGFSCTATVTCKCGATTDVILSDSVSASEFEEV